MPVPPSPPPQPIAPAVPTPRTRRLEVPPAGGGMRLDQFLTRWFRDFSRTALARGIRAGEVVSDGRTLRAGSRVHAGQVLEIAIAGIAPDRPPPPFPDILFEREGLLVVDKPAGLLCHPTGAAYAYALISLAKARHPAAELVHRIDRDTSGCVAITTDPALNRHLKAVVKAGGARKVYDAVVKGEVPWDSCVLDGPIGEANGPIRIQMAVTPDGKHARTDVEVVARQPGLTRVRCRLHTGRTHQIRVHLAHAGFPLLGDRLYGVLPEVFLRSLEVGADPEVVAAAGAPRHALHAAELDLPLPAGDIVQVRAPFPADLARWWADPSVLPHDPEPS